VELEAAVNLLSNQLSNKLLHNNLRDHEVENDLSRWILLFLFLFVAAFRFFWLCTRIRDVERAKYLALLSKFEEMSGVQDELVGSASFQRRSSVNPLLLSEKESQTSANGICEHPFGSEFAWFGGFS